MHERFAAENAEEGIPVALRIGNCSIERIEINHVALGFHINPAALATKVAGIEDRNVEKRREIFAALDAALELLDREHAFHAEVPGELPDAPHIRGAQCTHGKAWKHNQPR